MPFTLSLGLLLLLVAFGVYWLIPARGQNWLLVLISLAFCAAWDVRAAPLLLLSTLADYAIGHQLEWDRPERSRNNYRWLSVGLNVGMLVLFRSIAFLHHGPVNIGSHPAGVPSEDANFRLVIPLGLSFYTLQRLTHTFDAYNRVIRPCRSLLSFVLFVGFFPQIVSGPIERARNVLPQLDQRRVFNWDRFCKACWLISLGAFQKIFIADHAGEMVTALLAPEHPGRLASLFALYAYAVQIYADFAGYSDVARGGASLFGIEIMQNFTAPYLSQNISAYWQRWHISLSSFLFDYIYQPCLMQFRRWGTGATIFAAFVTFFASAVWHGTGLTFLIWGALHAAAFSAFALTKRLRKRLKKHLPSRLSHWLSVTLTFHFVCLGYLFFRASNLADVSHMWHELFLPTRIDDANRGLFGMIVAFTLGIIFLQALQLRHGTNLWVFSYPSWLRAICYATLLFLLLRYPGPLQSFVYAEF